MWIEVILTTNKRLEMKVLVVGDGGREHALVWKLAQSPKVSRLWCAPGNAGIGSERLSDGKLVENLEIAVTDIDGLCTFATRHSVDLVVVGPEEPLSMGICDRFLENDIPTFGPCKRETLFESSKSFSDAFMAKYDIPRPKSMSFGHDCQGVKPAVDFATFLRKCAVKASGLASGKGVFLCQNPAEAEEAIKKLLTEKALGSAGEEIVIQELLEGQECSVHAICGGNSYKIFPLSQDLKEAYPEGPLTGGMRAMCPVSFSSINAQMIEDQILRPWLEGCKKEDLNFSGLLYPGLMLTKTGPKVLEFNARFGDPETQVYMSRLESDLFDLLSVATETSGLKKFGEIQWSPKFAVCVILASAGYPGKYKKGKVITGLGDAKKVSGAKVFHSGTCLINGKVYTNGGRVLGVTAIKDSLKEAMETAYGVAEIIQFEGKWFRRD